MAVTHKSPDSEKKPMQMKANLITFRRVYERLLAFTRIYGRISAVARRSRGLESDPYMSLHPTTLYGFNEISG